MNKALKFEKNLPEYLCDIFVALMLFVYPLYYGPKGYNKIATSKWGLFLGITIAFVVLVLLAFAAIVLDEKKKKEYCAGLFKRTSIAHLLLFGYVGFTAISALNSSYDYVWLGFNRHDGVLTIALFVVTSFLLFIFMKPKKWHLYLFSLTLLINSVISILQFANLDPLSLYPANTDNYYGAMVYYSGQYAGTIGNVDLMAAFFCISIPLMLIYFVKNKSRFSYILLGISCVALVAVRLMWVQACVVGLAAFFVFTLPVVLKDKHSLLRTCIAYAASLFALAIGFMFSLDRGIVFNPSALVLPLLVGALLCIGAFIIIYLKGRDDMVLDRLCKLIWIALAVAILLAVIFIYVYPFESGLLYEVHEILHGRAQDSFGTSRIYIWRNVLEKLPDHLIFGTGPDTMKEALGLKFYRYGENGEVIKSVSIDAAHNEYLNILSNQGLFATLCYLGALGYTVYLWIKYRKNDGVCICGCAMLAYCVQGFFGFSMFITAPTFWIVWAGLLYFADKEERRA